MMNELLCQGAENAVPRRELIKMLHLRNPGDLTQIIEREWRGRFPICASTDCANPEYLMSKTLKKLERYIGSLHRRLQNVAETWRSCEDALLRMTGQRVFSGM